MLVYLISTNLPQYLSWSGGGEINLLEHSDNVPILLNWEDTQDLSLTTLGCSFM